MADLDKAAVKKQLLFYFSDSNYPNDQFMRKEAEKSDERWLDLAVFTKFNRLKGLGVTGVEHLQAALSDLPDDCDVELNEDKTKIRRRTPLPAEDVITKRSLYAKGWPRGAWPQEPIDPNFKEPTLDSVIELFENNEKCPDLKVRCVRLLRFKENKQHKGSCFVEFETEEMKDKCLAEGVAPLFNGAALVLEDKKAYFERKRQERKEKFEKRKRKREENGAKKAAEGNAKRSKGEADFERGLILHFSNVGPNANRDTIKERLGSKVQFVEYREGEAEGFARFSDADACLHAKISIVGAATEEDSTGGKEGKEDEEKKDEGTKDEQQAEEKQKGDGQPGEEEKKNEDAAQEEEKGKEIWGEGSVPVSVRILEGEEEDEYWKKLRGGQKKKRGQKRRRQ